MTLGTFLTYCIFAIGAIMVTVAWTLIIKDFTNHD